MSSWPITFQYSGLILARPDPCLGKMACQEPSNWHLVPHYSCCPGSLAVVLPLRTIRRVEGSKGDDYGGTFEEDTIVIRQSLNSAYMWLSGAARASPCPLLEDGVI